MLEAGDPYERRVSVAFAKFPSPLRTVLGGFCSMVSRAPSALTFVRKLTLDLAAVGLFFVGILLFASFMAGDAIILEAPSVPKALQDRGITPQLMIQKVQARVQHIRDVAQTSKLPETIKGPTLSTPAQEPLTIQAAGVHLSLNSVVLAIERLAGLENRRQVMMSFVCETVECQPGDFSFHVVGLGDRVVASGPVRFDPGSAGKNGDVLDIAADAAANHLLTMFDPYTLGIFNVRQKHTDDARLIANKMLLHEQNSRQKIWAYNLRGIVELEMGKPLTANRYFQRALQIDRGFLPAIVNAGSASLRAQEFNKAKESYYHALRIAPNHPAVHSNLAKVFYLNCSLMDAANALELATSLDPSDSWGYWALEVLKLLRDKDKQNLATLYHEAINAEPDHVISLPDLDILIGVALDCAENAENAWKSTLPDYSTEWALLADHP